MNRQTDKRRNNMIKTSFIPYSFVVVVGVSLLFIKNR